MSTPLIVILAIIAILIIWVIVLYNGLVRERNVVGNAFSDINVQLKKRYDLIPNLVETVKGYATHEKATFEKTENVFSFFFFKNRDIPRDSRGSGSARYLVPPSFSAVPSRSRASCSSTRWGRCA